MLNCYVCGNPFTRQFSLKKRKHAQSNVESKKENPKVHDFTENGPKLRHPFTMMVAASTGEGKTWFVKHLLENREQCTRANHMDLCSVTALVCTESYQV